MCFLPKSLILRVFKTCNMKNFNNSRPDFEDCKGVNAALKETIRKYDALINNLPGIVYRCRNNKNWDMEYISAACKHITGYSSHEFLSGEIHFTNLTLQEDHHQVWQNTQKSLDKKKPFNLEYTIKTKEGKLKYLWEQGEGVFDTDGNLLAIEGYITDVTPQKKAEIAIKTSEAKTKALLDAIPDMMFIQDYDSNYLDFYAPDKVNLGVLSVNIIGKNMKDVLPLDVFKKVRKAQEITIKNKNMQKVEYCLFEKSGLRYYEARIAPLNSHSLLTIVRDVTEAQTNDALLKIRNNALSSASNAILITDAKQPKLPIIYCNSAFEKMTGYNKNDVLGKNCQFLQNDDRDQIEISIMKKAITNGEGCNVVLRNYKRDGQLFWNDVTITPIYNSAMELTHFIGVQNDVTYKVKEEHLKDQIRKILELIAHDKPIQTIGDKIIETTEMHVQHCLASILVLNREDKTLHKLVAPSVPKAFGELLEGIRIGPRAGSCGTAAFLKKEIIVSNIKTNILWHDFPKIRETASKNGLKACWSFPIMSSNSRVLGTFAIYSKRTRKPTPEEKEVISDMIHLASVTLEKYETTRALIDNKNQLEAYANKLEEKVQDRTQEVLLTVQKLVESNLNLEDQILIATQAEKKALASETLASAIAQNFPNGFIAVIDKNFKLLFAKGEVIEQLGLNQIIFDGLDINTIIDFSEERKERLKSDILRTLAGKHLSFEIEFKNKFFSVNTAPLYDGEKDPISALLVYNDITQQKIEEQNIKNALEKEKELNELKSSFISMASHEFRTPLSAILTSAVLIRKQNEPEKKEKREKYVAQIEKNVKNLVVILNDFLSLSKLEEGKITALPEEFDIIHFSEMVIREMKFSLKQNQKIHFNTTLDHLMVFLDTKLLLHVLNNLLSNASKYSPESTNIDFNITTNYITVRIEITDHGMGIPEDEQKDLFQRFFRAKNASNIEGTGLGLNIVKQYISIMNGQVDFKSKLNMGSTFYIELPINRT